MGITNQAVKVGNKSTYESGNILKAEELTLDNTEQIKAIDTNAEVLNNVITLLNDTASKSDKNSTDILNHWGDTTSDNATNENLLKSLNDLKSTVNDNYSGNNQSTNSKLNSRVTSLETTSATHTTDISNLKSRTATMYTMTIDSSSNGKTLIIKSVKYSE